MKKKVLKLVAVMVLGLLTIVISGCATHRADLVDAGVVSLERKHTGKVYISRINAYWDGEGFIVNGVVRRRMHSGKQVKTHLDIAILAPNGEILQETRTPDIYIPMRLLPGGLRGSIRGVKQFQVCFPDIPAQGSKVRVVAHSGQHKDKS